MTVFNSSPWPVLSIGSVCASKEIVDPSRAPNKAFRYVDIGSVSNVKFEILEARELLGKDAPSRARKCIRKGDVIVATTRPYLRSIARVPPELDGQICSTGFCVLRPTEKVTSDWLFYSALSREFLAQLTPKMRGASYPAVTDGDVLEIQIPMPSREDQIRIVGRIRKCVERIEEIDSLTSTIRDDAHHLPLALRYDLWENCCRKHHPVPLGSVVSSTKNGLYKPGKYHGSGAVLLRMFNINGALLDLSRIERMQVTEKEEQDFCVSNGDILVSRVNSRELVGKSALVQGLSERAVHEAMLVRVRVQDQSVHPRFLVSLMNSPQFLHDLRRRAKHAIGQSSVNQQDLLESTVPLPGLREQLAQIKRLEELSIATEALTRESTHDETTTTALRESVLGRAFAGEL
jgi:type I restriction enzyme, S subunit